MCVESQKYLVPFNMSRRAEYVYKISPTGPAFLRCPWRTIGLSNQAIFGPHSQNSETYRSGQRWIEVDRGVRCASFRIWVCAGAQRRDMLAL